MNEIFALHYKGKIVGADEWIRLSGCSRYNRKTRLYTKRHLAQIAIKEIKPEYRDKVSVVKYTPEVNNV